MVKDRLSSVQPLLAGIGLDAFAFFHLPNIRYLCGFTGSDGVLVTDRNKGCFLTDSRYTTQAQRQVAVDEIRQYRLKVEEVAAYVRELGAVRVGFEAETVPYETVRKLRENSPAGTEWVPVTKEVTALRGIKDEVEVAALEEAARLNVEALEQVLPQVRPGAVEREIALALEFALKRLGGEEKAFDFIVASGERGAMPHGVASDKVIAAGELVTLDFGTRYRGYHSDETVTVAVGEVSRRLREIHAIVLEAHDRAIDRVRPGVPLREIDAAARDFITGRGYGEYFGHGLGHGVGLEVHEYPTVSTRSEETAREGMVFTVEPGIYVPGLGGVRIEDMVLVTAAGCRRLTGVPKEFRALPG